MRASYARPFLSTLGLAHIENERAAKATGNASALFASAIRQPEGPVGSPIQHALDALRVERLPALVEVAGGEFGTDPTQTEALARLWTGPAQPLSEGHGLRAYIGQRFPPLALAAFLADATITRPAKLGYLIACRPGAAGMIVPAIPCVS
jgi:hypothetical protein